MRHWLERTHPPQLQIDEFSLFLSIFLQKSFFSKINVKAEWHESVVHLLIQSRKKFVPFVQKKDKQF